MRAQALGLGQRHDGRREARQAIRRLRRERPGTQIIVTGCFVAEDVVDAPNVSYVDISRRDELDALRSAIVTEIDRIEEQVRASSNAAHGR